MKTSPPTILLAVTGMSPAILTETVWALAHEKPAIIPERVVAVTTITGRQAIERALVALGREPVVGRARLPGLWLAFETVRRFVRVEWTPEVELNDGRGWGDGCSRELTFVESLMLPALIRGVAESRSTIRGHVYYRRTAAVPDFPPSEEVEPVPELAKYCLDELTAVRSRILGSDPGSLGLGEIPLPCSIPIGRSTA